MQIKCLEVVKELIRFPSVTPDHAGCIDYIESILEQEGFRIVRKEFEDNNSQVTNLYARLGKGKPNICFAGHIDVVPPGHIGSWKFNPFEPTEQDGYLYGRGAVDMKGAMGAMIAASINYKNQHPGFKGSMSFLITSDEEGDAIYGTKAMLEYINNIGEKIDLAIIGEPSSQEKIGDTMRIGRRGSINFRLEIFGKQGHAAYPEKARNPNRLIVETLSSLLNIEFDNGNEWFQPSNLEITSIDCGNNTENVIPHSTSAKFNIRYNDIHTKDSLITKIHNAIHKCTKDYQLDHRCNAEPFLCPPQLLSHSFIKASQEVTGIKPQLSCGGGTSDARFIKNYTNAIECGLLAHTAHQINEKVKISDLHILYRIYYEALRKLVM